MVTKVGIFNWQQKKIDNLIDNYFFGKSDDDDIDYGEKLLEMGKPAAERLFLALKSGKYDSSGLWLDGLSLLVQICNEVGEENIINEAFNVFSEDLDIQSLLFLLNETEGVFHDLIMAKLIKIGRQDLDYLIKEMDSDIETSKPITIVNDPGVKVQSWFYISNDYLNLLSQFKSSPKTIELLLKWFKDISMGSWRDIVKVLVDIGSPVVMPLIDFLFDSNEKIRSHAAFALGRIGDARAIESLTFVLQNDSSKDVIRNAAEALEKTGKSAINFLISSLHHQDQRVRKYAAEALGSLGANSALND